MDTEKKKILVVEDEPDVLQFIRQGLEESGFEVEFAYDGECGKKLALSKKYDVIILDIIIPQLNGLELCKKIRKQNNAAKILLLTALGTLDDKLEGFEIAGEDKVFYPATAKIIKRKELFVQSDKVPKPVAVRYAWRNWVMGSLYDVNLLPASSFRTDTWTDATQAKE